MKLRLLPTLIVLITVLSIFLGGCNAANPNQADTVPVTDLLGRDVAVPVEVKRVVAIGPGALRLYVYAGNLEYVVGVEEIEVNNPTGRPYLLANPGLAELPIIGPGGPNNAPDPERILTVAPDVIFSTYATESSIADELQAKTGIPVVAISYGHTGFGATNLFTQGVPDSLLLIGQITGDSVKARAAIDFLNHALEDLGQRTRDIPEADKPSVYVGALGARGAHGIESTQGDYSLLNAIHAKNVVDETGQSGSIMIDKEKLLDWDPDYLFIDQGGFAVVLEDYRKNPMFYESLAAVQNGQVYAQLPYNYYNTNIDTALADAYYLGKILYPAAFADVDPAQQADEIYRALLGQPVYAQMAEAFGGFKPLRLSEEQ